MASRAWHRVRQFFGALRPHVDQAERAAAYQWLTPDERTVFETMMLRDQQHGIVVWRRVRDTASDDRDLLTAALLHDCGKGEVRLWQRVAHVVLPGGLELRLCSKDGAPWRRALWRLRYHPAIGAGMAQAAGSPPEVVRLIREQDADAPDGRLAALQAADNA